MQVDATEIVPLQPNGKDKKKMIPF